MRIHKHTRPGQALTEVGLVIVLVAIVSLLGLSLVSGGVGSIFSSAARSLA